MKNRIWMNILMATLVAGLMMTVSCSKPTVVSSEAGIEDQAAMDAAAKAAEQERIKAQQLKEQMAQEKAMKEAKIVAAKKRFLNQNIHFDYDSAELSPMAKTVLKEKAEWLMTNPAVRVIVQGHCDERGTTEYNIALGERRAQAVKKYLANLGIAASRMDMISYGEERPLDPAANEAAYRKNRRAQFVLQ